MVGHVWFMCRVEPQRELSSARQLLRRGIYACVPRQIGTARAGIGGRRGPKVRFKTIAAHGYVFVARDAAKPDLHELAFCRAIKAPVMFAGIPVQIKNHEMRQWSVQLSREPEKAPTKTYEKGTEIIVKAGVFAAHHGIVDWAKDGLVKVEVMIFGRSTPITIGIEDVETPREREQRMGQAKRRPNHRAGSQTGSLRQVATLSTQHG